MSKEILTTLDKQEDESIKCTFDEMGECEFPQPTFDCANCYLNNVCYQCIETCHKDCQEKPIEKSNFNKNPKFICKCGQQRCHKVQKKKTKNEKEPCDMIKLDQYLKLNKKYFCETHNVVICSMCYYKCHSSCSTLEDETQDANNTDTCKCENENHCKNYLTSLDSENLSYNPYPIQFENNLQTINVILKSGSIHTKQYILSIFERKAYIDEDFINYIIFFIGIMGTDKYTPHVFVKELRESFPYEESLKPLSLYKPQDLKQVYVKILFIECLYFFNIKRDFWKIKTLSFSDFRTNSINVRLNYRKFILSKNIFTQYLHEKYLFCVENNDMNLQDNITTLKGLAINLGSLLSMHMQDMTEVNFEMFKFLFKFIKLLLRHMLFSITELNLLISSLYEYFMSLNEFLEKTELHIENLCCDNFAKIFFLIAISYNDLIVEEKLNKKENLFFTFSNSSNSSNSSKNKNFIQIENDYTEKLLKMILLNKKFFALHSKNLPDQNKVPTVNKIIDESLNLFLNFDNIYLKQFKYFNTNYLESLSHGILYTPNRGEEIIPFYFLKNSIEQNIEDFFAYNIHSGREISPLSYYNHSVTLLKKFLEKISKIFSEKNWKNFRKNPENLTNNNDTYNLDNKILKYQEGLSNKLKKTFPEIAFILDNPDKHLLNHIIQLLIEASLDNCITFFLKTLKTILQDSKKEEIKINIFFDFLSIFMLSKSGFICLTTGGNIDRIISLVEYFEKEVTEFIHSVIKFSKIYQVDLSNHKIIQLIQKQIIKKEINKNTDNVEFTEKLIQKMRIINSLEDILEYDEYEKQKKEILQLISAYENIKRLVFLDSEKFLEIFENEENLTKINLSKIQKKVKSKNEVDLGVLDVESENDKENLLLLNENPITSQRISNNRNNSISNSKKLLLNNEEKNDNFENQEIQIHSINYNEIHKDKDDEIITATKLKKENEKDSENSENSENSPDNHSSSPEAKLMYRFYFAFFKLFSKNSFFYYHFYNLNEEDSIQNIVHKLLEITSQHFLKAKTPLLTINKRSILINTIRTFHFNDKIHSEDINKRVKYLTNDDYVIVKTFSDKKFADLLENKFSQEKYDNEIKPKYEEFLKLKSIIEIFIAEINQLDGLIFLKKQMNIFNDVKFADYACELLYSVKFIADFILTQDIWNGIYSSLYNLAEELIFKSETLRELLSKTTYNYYGDNNSNNNNYSEKIILPFPELFEKFENSEKNSKNTNKLKKHEIYKTISEIFFQLTQYYDNKNNFSSALKYLDKFNLLNFSSYSIADPERYRNFYHDYKKGKIHSNTTTPWENVYKYYKSQLSEFENSTFLKLICRKKTEKLDFDFEQTLIKFIEGDFLTSEIIPRRELFWKIMLLNYMMFYDTDGAHSKLTYLLKEGEKISIDYDKDLEFEEQEKNNTPKEESTNTVGVNDNYVYYNFWAKLNRILNKSLVLNYTYSGKIFDRWFDTEMLLLTQEIIHFLQLLSEKQNKTFHKIIFNPLIEGKRSFFDIIVDNFIYIIDFLKFDYLEDVNLPYDILLVTFDNIVNFLIEYLQTADGEYFKIFEAAMENKIFKNLSKIIFINSKPRGGEINNNKGNNNENFKKSETFSKNFENSENFSKYQNSQNSLLNHNSSPSSQRENVLLFVQSKFIKLLIYFTEQRPAKIPYIIKEYPVSKLYEQIYFNFTNLVNHFMNKNLLREDIFYIKKTSFVYSFRNFYLSNRDFRDSLKFNVCLRLYHLNKILVKLYDQQSFKDYLKEIEIDPKREEGRIMANDPNFKLLLTYKIRRLLRLIIVRIDIQMNGVDHPVFFTRPFITYSLTNQTKINFLQNVNRDNTYNKLSSLIEKTDFFIFEMICNSKISKNSFLHKILFFKMNYSLFEKINYLIIVAHQCLLIYYFYKSTTLNPHEYNNFNEDEIKKISNENLILGLVQIVILIFVLINWMFNKFPQKYQEILMSQYGRKFVFKNIRSGADDVCPSYTTLKDIYRKNRISDYTILWSLNKNFKNMEAGRVLIDALFFNREINVLFLTIIILIVYLATGMPFVLVIPTIFIMNLSTTLYDILIALKLRWRQLLAVLLFTYLCIYLFSWMGLLWINKLFNYPDTVDPKTVRKRILIYFGILEFFEFFRIWIFFDFFSFF
jgi:hypothetical protein